MTKAGKGGLSGFVHAAGVGLGAAALLAAWNVLHAALAYQQYRAGIARAADLFLLAAGAYLPMVLAPLLILSAGARVVAARRVADPARLRAWHAGAAAGIMAALYGAGALAAGRPGGPAAGIPRAMDVLGGLLCAAACAAFAGRIALGAQRSAVLASFIRRAIGALAGLFLSLLLWVAVRDRLGPMSPPAAAAIALGCLLAGILGGIGALEAVSAAWKGARRLTGRRTGLVAVLLVGSVTLAALRGADARTAPAGPPTGAPNVLVLVGDTLRADHVGCYGAPRPATPALDALAARGARVAEMYANSSWTVPSTTTLLTGLHPSSHGLMTYQDRLRESAVSIAEVFGKAGYATAGFTANPVLTEDLGFGSGFDTWEEEIIPRRLDRHRDAPVYATLTALGLWSHPQTFPRAEDVVARALDWLDRSGSSPFFLYLQFMDPHDPYAPPPPYDTMYAAPGREPMAMKFGTLPDIMQGTLRVGPEDLEDLLALYDGAITYMDAQIGRLLEEMERRGLSQQTLVVFTSDHGEEFNEHGGLGHEHTLHEELIRLPFIAAGPGVAPGTVLPGPARSVDVAPTILAAAGLEFPLPVEGVSFAASLGGREALAPRDVFMEETYIGIRGPWHAFRALRQGSLKVIGRSFHAGGGDPWRWEMFDLAADPAESADIALARPDEATRLREKIAAWARRPRAGRPGQAPLDEELERRLRALGYLQ